MDDLETLNNKELHKKCVEYGISNVPVTDSTRKLLLRRLKAAISGKPSTTTKKATGRGRKPHSKSSTVDDFIDAKLHVTNSRNNKAKTAVAAVAANKVLRHAKVAIGKQETTTKATVKKQTDVKASISHKSGAIRSSSLLSSKTKPSAPQKSALLFKLPEKKTSSTKTAVLSRTPVTYTSYIQESSIKKTYIPPEDDDYEEDDHNYLFKPLSYSSNNSHAPSTSTSNVATSLNSRTHNNSLGSSYGYGKPATKFSTSSPYLTSYRPRNF